jgi:general secretion pathway protein G
MQSRIRTAGFTLIELLVVVAVIGIISTIAIIAVASALDRARQHATMADMRNVARAIEAYVVDNNFPPDSAGGLPALVTVLIPYQASVLPVRDHWRREIAYVADSAGNYTLESYGKDGVPGVDITLASRFDFDLDIVITNGLFIAAPE